MTNVIVRVIGLTWDCWKCGKPTLCILGSSSGGPRDYLLGDRESELALRLLTEANRSDVTNQLAPSGNGLASHCSACGIVQGNFYVQQEALERAYWGDDKAAYEILAVGTVEQAEWRQIEDGEFPW